MAEIKFTGFVQDWKKDSAQHPNWAMKTAETHQKKDGDTFKTVARTYRTIKAAYGKEIDFTQFNVGDRVTIEGWEITEANEYDGQNYYTLVVRADNVTIAEGKKADFAAHGFTPVDDETPF